MAAIFSFFMKKNTRTGTSSTCTVQIGYVSREDHPLAVKSGFHVAQKKNNSGVRRPPRANFRSGLIFY
jgi:hypothetical protein